MTTTSLPADHTTLPGQAGRTVHCLECGTECHFGSFWCACCRARNRTVKAASTTNLTRGEPRWP